jgi:uncharacterized membrane protein YedE/YeeE
MGTEAAIAALAGGALIGLGAVVLMACLGRVAGIAGIVGSALDGLLSGRADDVGWRVAFLAGLIIGPWLPGWAGQPPPTIEVTASLPVVIVAGLLVGFGTRLGNGCTSGHGVCGIARLSPRSLAATGVFMSVAVIVVFVVRHLVGG